MFSNLNVALAQKGQTFWFAAPEVTESGNHDRPIWLRVITYSSPATVTITQPAGGGMPAQTMNIAANQTQSLDLSAYINNIETGIISANNHNDNAVENKGLYISATADISVYYEVTGMDVNNPDPAWRTQIWNSDIFVLKGDNALGTKFYTPFQDKLKNWFDGWAGIHIVATEDNTKVTITPTKNMVGRLAGFPFTITLNKGQTYSNRAVSQEGIDHPGGTLITSDKPIAVTVKDDSMGQINSADLGGDQLVPVSVTGTDYIVIKGEVNTEGGNPDYGDRAIICATENGTTVTINGVLQPGTLSAGQQLNYKVTQLSEYIVTSKPVYVFHISGFGNELGGALLPPIKCTGSKQVSFTRDTDEPFYLLLLVKTADKGNFTLNGNSTLITSGAFSTVPNTPVAGEWSQAKISFNTTQIPSNTTITVNNSGFFHVGIINGQSTQAGARYGYFSDYGTSSLSLGSDVTICQGDSNTFDVGPGVSDIFWNGVSSTSQTYTASVAGKYWVQGELSGCVGVDTVNLFIDPVSEGGLAIANDSPVCSGSQTSLTLSGQTGTIQWQQSSAGNGPWTNVTGGTGNTAATYMTPALTATTFYKAVVTSGVCANVSSVIDTVVVDSTTVGGTATATDPTICSGNFTTIKLSGNTGSSIQWQQSVNGVDGWINVTGGSGGTTATYTTPNLTSKTYYMAVVTSGVCSSANSTVASVTIDSVSVAGTATTPAPVICANTSTTVSLSGNVGSIQWEQSADSITWVNAVGGSGANSATYTTPNLTSGIIYYQAHVTSGVCASVNTDPVKIKVDAVSESGSAAATSPAICKNTSTTVSLSGYSGNIQWQQSADSTSWVNVTGGSGATSATYSTPDLAVNTFYRAIVTSGVCDSVVSNAVKVRTDTVPITGTATAASPSVCMNTSTIVSIDGVTGTIQWQESADSTVWNDISNATSANYATPDLTVATYYRAVVSSGTCAPGNSTPVKIKIDSSSVGGTVTAISPICQNGSTTISLTGSRGSIQWQESADGLNPWADVTNGSGETTANYTTGALSVTTYFRALVINGSCSPVTSSIDTVVVNAPAVGGTITPGQPEVCKNDSVTFEMSGNAAGTIQWQQSSDTTNQTGWSNVTTGTGATTTSYTTSKLITTTYFRALISSGGCSSNTSPTATATVNPTSVGGTSVVNAPAICSGASATVSLSGNTGSIQWMQSTDASNWSDISGANALSYTATNLTNTTYFMAKVTSGVCPAANSIADTVIVSPVSESGTATGTSSICSGGSTTVSLSGFKGTIQWAQSVDGVGGWTNANGAGSTTNVYTTPALTTTMHYRANVKSGICPSVNSGNVIVTVTPPSAGGVTSTMSPICENTSATISLTGQTGTIEWQESTDSIAWNTIIPAATSVNYTTPNLTSTRYYRAVVKNGVCPQTLSSAVKVLVAPQSKSGSISASSSSICPGQSTTLTVVDALGSIQWQQSSDTTVMSNWNDITGETTNSYSTPLLHNTTYYRVVVTNGVCVPSTSTKSIVEVKIVPSFNLSEKDTIICTPDNIVLTASSGFTNYVWNNGVPGPTISVYTAGTYSVTAISPNSCPVSAIVLISPCNSVDIPNVITPLSTTPGLNDYFVIRGNIPDSELEIYNRWGIMVYYSHNYENNWDAENVVEGIYFYIYKRKEGKTYKGYLEVIR